MHCWRGRACSRFLSQASQAAWCNKGNPHPNRSKKSSGFIPYMALQSCCQTHTDHLLIASWQLTIWAREWFTRSNKSKNETFQFASLGIETNSAQWFVLLAGGLQKAAGWASLQTSPFLLCEITLAPIPGNFPIAPAWAEHKKPSQRARRNLGCLFKPFPSNSEAMGWKFMIFAKFGDCSCILTKIWSCKVYLPLIKETRIVFAVKEWDWPSSTEHPTWGLNLKAESCELRV